MKLNIEVKEQLKKEFTLKCIQKYGREPKRLDSYSLFTILGDTVVDIANVNSKECKKKIYANQKKQLIYFSMELIVK